MREHECGGRGGGAPFRFVDVRDSRSVGQPSPLPWESEGIRIRTRRLAFPPRSRGLGGGQAVGQDSLYFVPPTLYR